MLTLLDRPYLAGGAERVALAIATRLDPGRFDRLLCATRTVPAAALEELGRQGVRVYELGRSRTLDMAAWRRFVALLRHESVDILHAHMFGSNLWGTVLGRLARVPVVIAHEHTWSYEGQPLRRLADREIIARLASVFVAVSEADRRRMIEVEGIDPDRIRVIRNGIPRLPSVAADVREELGLPRRAPVIGTVAVLRRQKALEVLLEATALVRRQVPDVRLLVVGDGPEAGRLRTLAGELDLGPAVHFLGERRDVPDILRALDLAVVTSDFEGLPLSVLEYMAAGLPVVATRVGGVPEAVEHGVSGLLVERRDPAAVARAVVELLHDPGRRAAMGAAGRERHRREFSLDAFVARVEALYEDLWRAACRSR